MKKILALCATILTALLLPLNAAPAQATTVVNQGDRLSTPIEGRRIRLCTVGFVDKAHQRLVTAAHCSRNGDPVTVNGEVVGTFRQLAPHDGYDYRNDIAYVDITNPAVLGSNAHGPSDGSPMVPGRMVCAHNHVTNTDGCNVVVRTDGFGVNNNGFVLNAPLSSTVTYSTVKGDSGGPVWDMVTGRFVGIVSGNTIAEYVFAFEK